MAEGIEVRHREGCPALEGKSKRCRCKPAYRAAVWDPATRRRVRRTFPTRAAAKTWRADATTAARKGALRAPDPRTIRDAAVEFLDGARAGTVRDRSGRPYKPSTLRTYDEKLRAYVLPVLGARRLTDVRRPELQQFVDELLGDGLSPSSVRNTLDPLRAIYRRAMARELLAANPTSGLDLPSARPQEQRIPALHEARALVESLPARDRATWATAFYAGLRRGELQALPADAIDLGRSEIRISRSWDQAEGEIEPKTATSARTVPLLGILRDYLDAHLLATARSGSELAFGRTTAAPFVPSTLRNRARAAWVKAGLQSVGLHEARHCFASLLIASGANPKAVQEFMGHSTIAITFNLYGHLFPGARDETRQRADRHIAEALGTHLGQSTHH